MDTEKDFSGNPTEEGVIAIIGEDLMSQLSRDLGGRRLFVPLNPGEHSPIAVSVGLDAAQKIGQAFGGSFFDVPLTSGTRKLILELYDSGMPKVRISAKLRKSIRHVRRVINEARPDGDQMDFFHT